MSHGYLAAFAVLKELALSFTTHFILQRADIKTFSFFFFSFFNINNCFKMFP